MMLSPAARTGILYVLAAPSGTGKSTLARRLLERVPNLEFSVSYTTRPRRTGEQDGSDYHFVDRARFEEMAAGDALLEWAAVFGELYGTGREQTLESLGQGRDLLLDIDVQGARHVRQSAIPAVTVMILPPDFETLVARLRGRASESEPQLGRRLTLARREVEAYSEFDYLVVNENLDQTVGELESIVRAERHRTVRCSEQAEQIVASFPA